MAKYKGIWPAPIYVATFADGSEQRASFFSAANKPMACHYARQWEAIEYVARAPYYSTEPGPHVMPTRESIDASLARYYSMPPRADLVAGYVELDGSRVDDPHFARAAVVALPKRRAKVDPIDGVPAALDQRLAA